LTVYRRDDTIEVRLYVARIDFHDAITINSQGKPAQSVVCPNRV
jgi:hypothetical protein